MALPALRQVVAGPRGDLVAVLDERGGVTIRDDVTGRPVANLVEGSDICGLAAGAVLAGAGRHQVVRLWPWPERRDR